MQKQLDEARARAANGDALDFVQPIFGFGLMVGLVVNYPAWGWLVPTLLVCLLWYLRVVALRHRRELLAERAGESICTFARSFPRRSVDTWVLRAVWSTFTDPEVALRADDRMWIEGGDVDWEQVASLAGRYLDRPEASQRLDDADTIADVVHLLDALPRRAAA